MARILYAATVIALIGGSAMAAKDLESRRGVQGGAAIAFLTTLQR